ncbi:hypothetical protein [Virgisporangium ochraceum]|uniref:hypothetical protein n=1 Tax=Virgisporangium ochraceum TaxID=65505 RepID=UPI001940F45B|nr:hypothetical protein [Virgisporangium ochraceum]
MSNTCPSTTVVVTAATVMGCARTASPIGSPVPRSHRRSEPSSSPVTATGRPCSVVVVIEVGLPGSGGRVSAPVARSHTRVVPSRKLAPTTIGRPSTTAVASALSFSVRPVNRLISRPGGAAPVFQVVPAPRPATSDAISTASRRRARSVAPKRAASRASACRRRAGSTRR